MRGTGSADTATQVLAGLLGANASPYSHVGQVDGRLDDMLKRASGSRQDRFEIYDRLARLLDDIIGDHLPALWIESPHPRDINPRSNHRRMRKWAGRLRGLGCVNEPMCGHDPIESYASFVAFAPIQFRRALAVENPDRRSISFPSRNKSRVGTR